MPQLAFGVQIEPQFGFTYTDVLDIARDAEAAGFDSLWCSDHLFLNERSVDTNCLEAWSVLSALSVQTTRLRLGPLVACQSYRNPALLAKIAATVDHLSNGRLELGVGAGWKQREYEAYGYPFPAPRIRLEQLADTLEIVRRLWSEERATYEGRHYRVRDAQCAPKPVQRPRPRVWIGGTKPRLLRIAARYADAVNVGGFPTEEGYAEAMTQLDEGCRKIGRDPTEVLRSHFLPTLVAETREQVDAVVAEAAARGNVSAEEWRARRPGWAVGTVDEVAARIRSFAGAGMRYAILLFPYRREREMVRLAGERLLPALRD